MLDHKVKSCKLHNIQFTLGLELGKERPTKQPIPTTKNLE